MRRFYTKKYKEIRSTKSKLKLLEKIFLGAFILSLVTPSFQQISLGKEEEPDFLEDRSAYSSEMRLYNLFSPSEEKPSMDFKQEKGEINPTSHQQSKVAGEEETCPWGDDPNFSFFDFPSIANVTRKIGGNFTRFFTELDIGGWGIVLSIPPEKLQGRVAQLPPADRARANPHQLVVGDLHGIFFQATAAVDTAALLVDPTAREKIWNNAKKIEEAGSEVMKGTSEWSTLAIAINEFLDSIKDKIATVQGLTGSLFSLGESLGKKIKSLGALEEKIKSLGALGERIKKSSNWIYRVTDLSNGLATTMDLEKAFQKLKDKFKEDKTENKKDSFFPILNFLKGFLAVYKVGGGLLPDDVSLNEGLFRDAWFVHNLYLSIADYMPLWLKGPQLGLLVGDLITKVFEKVGLSFQSAPHILRLTNIASAYGFLLSAIASDLSYTEFKGQVLGALVAKVAAPFVQTVCLIKTSSTLVCQGVASLLPILGGKLGELIAVAFEDNNALAASRPLHKLRAPALPERWIGFDKGKNPLLMIPRHSEFERVVDKAVNSSKDLFITVPPHFVLPKKRKLSK